MWSVFYFSPAMHLLLREWFAGILMELIPAILFNEVCNQCSFINDRVCNLPSLVVLIIDEGGVETCHRFIDGFIRSALRNLCTWICMTRRREPLQNSKGREFLAVCSWTRVVSQSPRRNAFSIRKQETNAKAQRRILKFFYGHSFAKARQEPFVLYPLGTKNNEKSQKQTAKAVLTKHKLLNTRVFTFGWYWLMTWLGRLVSSRFRLFRIAGFDQRLYGLREIKKSFVEWKIGSVNGKQSRGGRLAVTALMDTMKTCLKVEMFMQLWIHKWHNRHTEPFVEYLIALGESNEMGFVYFILIMDFHFFTRICK